MICPHCGSKIAKNVVLCPHCNKITDSAPSSPAKHSSGANNRSQSQMSGKQTKGGTKKTKHTAIGVVLVLLVVFWAIGSSGGNKKPSTSKSTSKDSTSTSQKEVSQAPTTDAEPPVESGDSIKSGSYTLPSGYEIYFSDSVRNDVTGRWRISTTADSFVPAEYAVEYYETMFSSDDEVHAIWNATLGTTTSITASSGIVFASTYEYVNGEEHDAKKLFSGMLLNSKMFDAHTGEEITNSKN